MRQNAVWTGPLLDVQDGIEKRLHQVGAPREEIVASADSDIIGFFPADWSEKGHITRAFAKDASFARCDVFGLPKLRVGMRRLRSLNLDSLIRHNGLLARVRCHHGYQNAWNEFAVQIHRSHNSR